MTWVWVKEKNQNGFCSDLLDPAAAVRATRSEPDTPCVGLAKCSAGNREGRDAGPRLRVASKFYFLEGTVQSRVPSLRGRVFNFEFYDVVFAPHIHTRAQQKSRLLSQNNLIRIQGLVQPVERAVC